MAVEIRGCGTALVTPFHRDGSVDEPALRRLVQRQLEGGVDFLTTCGATGEEATLDESECDRVTTIVVDEVGGRVPVVGSVCGNNTRKMVGRVSALDRLGIDAVLCVTPYYTIPTQDGIVAHFEMLARHSTVPIILYNVPGRTVVNMHPATVARLADHPNIIGIKEASSSLTQLTELLLEVPTSFRVFAGYDRFVFPFMCLGAIGVISPTANIVPSHMTRLVHLALEGRYAEARQMNALLWRLIRAAYMEVNPLPVKAALAMMGLIEEHYRPPLSPMRPELKARLEETLAAHGLLTSDRRVPAR
jgi:4-hydroxy-tetrahydrodipicolinate synthase